MIMIIEVGMLGLGIVGSGVVEWLICLVVKIE